MSIGKGKNTQNDSNIERTLISKFVSNNDQYHDVLEIECSDQKSEKKVHENFYSCFWAPEKSMCMFWSNPLEKVKHITR